MRDPERVTRSYPIMLSGGMRQRVLIAMALLSEPKLLIADEPGTALDVTTQAQILKLLKDLVEARGLALMMITHNLGVVRETSSYVYVMHKGVIVEAGPTAELFAAPKNDYTRAPDRRRAAAHRRHPVRHRGGARMSRPMLEIVDLYKEFPVRNAFGRRTGEVKAVDHVTFSIARGQVYGLVGESGSGKSTIARMIMGLHGADQRRHPARRSQTSPTAAVARGRGRKVQMVFQNPGSSLNPRRTVGQSIAVPLDAHGHPRARARPPHRRAPRDGAAAGRSSAQRYPARAVRRPEAARRHRPRTGRGARAARARRADLGARRFGAGQGASTCSSISAAGCSSPSCSSPTISA